MKGKEYETIMEIVPVCPTCGKQCNISEKVSLGFGSAVPKPRRKKK